MKSITALPLFAIVLLSGCNSMYVKPNTVDKTQTVYADRGGFSMRRSVKERLEERGYKVVVGKSNGVKDLDFDDGSIGEIESTNAMGARYRISVKERRESFQPVWCVFNGFWWWNFNVSIADQKTGEELMSWRGRGCANSSLAKLDDALDKLEK